MANFIFEDIKSTFRTKGNSLGKIILANIIVFVITNLIEAFLRLGGGDPYVVNDFFSLPANFIDFLIHFWSIFTYMFLHGGFFHILFNMLWLYWMGKILSEYIGNKAFISIYFIGGFVGGALYLAVYNLMHLISPGLHGFSLNSHLLGASAGVLSVVVATGALLPNNSINLMFIGPVKLKYIAIGSVILTSLIDFHSNTGGKIAHLGGALYGYYYIRQRQSGKDVGNWFHQFILIITGIFRPRPKTKMKVAYKKTKDDIVYNAQKVSEQQQIDSILDKISKSGYESLTKAEKDFLFKVSNSK